MDQWQIMMGLVLAIVAVVGIGAAARRANWLTEEADATLMKLVIRVLYPALILHMVVGNDHVRDPMNLLAPPLVGFGTVVAGFAVGWLVAHLLGKPLGLDTSAKRRTFALCVGIYNYGYIPIPLAEDLFGQGTVGVLFVHNVGVEVALWTVGIVLASGGVGRHWWRRLFNPPILAVVAAVVLNLLRVDEVVPGLGEHGLIRKVVEMLGRSAIPMALLLIGATVADYFKEAQLTQGGRVVFASGLVRLGLLPAVFVALAMAMQGAAELQQVILIQAAMPAAVFPIVLARHYDGDVPTALRIVLGTSLLSLVTMPLWLWAGMSLMGLSAGS